MGLESEGIHDEAKWGMRRGRNKECRRMCGPT